MHLGSTLVSPGIMGVLPMVKSHSQSHWLCSLLATFCWQQQCWACDGSLSHLAAFLSYFLILFPQFCPLAWPAPWPLPHKCFLGEGAVSSLHRAACCCCAPQQGNGKQAVLLAATALQGWSQADGSMLNEQPAIEWACLSAWALLCMCIPCLPKLGFSVGACAPAGISSGRWGAPPLSPQTLVPKVSLCSHQLFPESSQAFSRTCVCVWLGFTLCNVISLNLQVRQIFYLK